MHIHHPGRPEDLPQPEELWSRWGLAAVLTASVKREAMGLGRSGWWVDGDALRADDGGTSWWVLRRSGPGRFFLCGEDESGDVIGFEPPVDLFAGAPGWLSSADVEASVGPLEIGCLYWWEDDRWDRAPYSAELDDDGVDFGLSGVLSARNLLSALDWEEIPELAGTVQELAQAASERKLTVDQVEIISAHATAAGGPALDLPAAQRALRATGLDGSPPVA